jgi:hypothetical protein
MVAVTLERVHFAEVPGDRDGAQMFENLKKRYKEWRRKREWNAELQLQHLRMEVMQDNCWMSHNRIVSELTSRYLRMLSDNWESQPQESAVRFRDRIGLNPHKSQTSDRDPSDTTSKGDTGFEVTINGVVYIPRDPLNTEAMKLLSEVYAALWAETYYDAFNDSTANFAAPLCGKMEKANKILHFRK